MMPKISVILTTYNRAHFVCDAINSVLNQAYQDFEFIVVDNGSMDNTQDTLKKYANSISSIYLQKNQGRAQARNTGIKLAKGDYIAFLDDDDIWLPDKLEKQVIFLDSEHNFGLVHSFTEVVDEQGVLLQEETKKRFKFYKKAMKIGYNYEGMSKLCIMFISSVVVRKRCFDKIGLFDPEIEGGEDWDFYLRFALRYRIGIIPEPLVRSRIHKKQSTSDECTSGRIKTAVKHLTILNSYNELSSTKRMRYNFYLHLAYAYYIDMQLKMFQTYCLKILKMNPFILFKSRLGLHFLVSMLPAKFIRIVRHRRSLKSEMAYRYPERIIPHETSAGALAAHLKRYDFANCFCSGRVVLDAACGMGYGSNHISERAKEVIGIDISGKAIAYAIARYQRDNLFFKQMDVCKIRFPDNYFDTVCSFETIEHLNEPRCFLSEVKRVLKKDGIFVVSTPNFKKTSYGSKNPYHKIEFSIKDFKSILADYFSEIEIFGQRRSQSIFHYCLQRIDIFHMRAILPHFVRRAICHAVATQPIDEARLEDFIISKEKIAKATELVVVCRYKN